MSSPGILMMEVVEMSVINGGFGGGGMVMATGHGANSLTFSAKGEKPVTDLPIQVTVFE